MKYFILYTSLFLSLLACTRDLDVPLPTHEPKLTLNAILSEGDPIDLYLSRSFGLTEQVTTAIISIRDAEVELWKDGEFLTDMRFVDTTIVDTTYIEELPDTTFYYTLELSGAKYIPVKQIGNPRAGESYRFVVRHPVYGQAEAETRIPALPIVNQAFLQRDSLTFQDIEGFKDDWSALTLYLDDPPGLGDYYNYLVGLDYEREDDLGDSVVITKSKHWVSLAQEILRDPDGYTWSRPQALSDEAFDGQAHQQLWWFTFPINYYWTSNQGVIREGYNHTRMSIIPIRLTEALAKFQDKLRLQSETRLDGIESAFVPTESVIVPSNVVGGYGMVGAFNVGEEFVIELE